MKKLILGFGLFAMIAVTACKKEVDPAAPAEPTVHETTIVMPPPPPPTIENIPPPPPPPPIVKPDGTSIKIGSNGISVDTKNGTKGTAIEVKDGKANVEIKK